MPTKVRTVGWKKGGEGLGWKGEGVQQKKDTHLGRQGENKVIRIRKFVSIRKGGTWKRMKRPKRGSKQGDSEKRSFRRGGEKQL